MRKTRKGWAIDWNGNPPYNLSFPDTHSAFYHRGAKGTHYFHIEDIERYLRGCGVNNPANIEPSTIIDGVEAAELVARNVNPYRIS